MLGLLLTLRETYTLNRLSSFRNVRRKGGKFDHRPERPKMLLRHCPPPRFRTPFPSASTPVDVVFSHCTLCRSLELHWQHAVQLTNVVFRTSKTNIQCSGCQLHILLLHEKFHTTIYRVAYSNACIRIFIVCKISTAFRGVPAKTNSVPARDSRAAPISIPPPRYSRNIYPNSRRIRGIPAIPTPVQTSVLQCRRYRSVYTMAPKTSSRGQPCVAEMSCNSQGSVATRLRCAGVLVATYFKFAPES